MEFPGNIVCKLQELKAKNIISQMASLIHSLLLCVIVLSASLSHSHAQLTQDFYNNVCPKALSTIKSIVSKAIKREPRMGASLLRLHFHDCFVNVSSFFHLCSSRWSLFCLNHAMYWEGFLYVLIIMVRAVMGRSCWMILPTSLEKRLHLLMLTRLEDLKLWIKLRHKWIEFAKGMSCLVLTS